jgi:hypothetical protein
VCAGSVLTPATSRNTASGESRRQAPASLRRTVARPPTSPVFGASSGRQELGRDGERGEARRAQLLTPSPIANRSGNYGGRAQCGSLTTTSSPQIPLPHNGLPTPHRTDPLRSSTAFAAAGVPAVLAHRRSSRGPRGQGSRSDERSELALEGGGELWQPAVDVLGKERERSEHGIGLCSSIEIEFRRSRIASDPLRAPLPFGRPPPAGRRSPDTHSAAVRLPMSLDTTEGLSGLSRGAAALHARGGRSSPHGTCAPTTGLRRRYSPGRWPACRPGRQDSSGQTFRRCDTPSARSCLSDCVTESSR